MRKTPPQTERGEHHRRLTWGGIPHTNELLDKAAAAFSIELRFPFWDVRLVEYCLALPPQQKLHRGWNRMVMRRAMEGILPEEIRWRGGKTDLQPAFERGLLRFERGLLDDVLLKNTATIEAYANADSLKDAYRRYTATYPESAPLDTDMLAIWKAVSLAVWLRRTNLAERPDIVGPAR
jgi:asparagine synthase (glutamine-hydrolysing)